MPGENDITKVEPKRQLKMIELDHLTEQEQQVIIDVLQRDEILRKNEESRIRKLRLELQDLRRQGTIREGDDSKNLCARCREPLGMFASAEVCPKCKHKVCKTCQVYTPSGKRWVCKICHKSMQIKIESGEWFYEKLEVDNVRLFGSDLVKASLDRVHTRSKGNMSSPNSFEEQDESSRQHYQGRHNHHSGTPRSTPRGTPRGTPSGTPRGMSPHNSPHRRRANRNQDSVSVTSSESHRSHSQQSQIAHSESGSSRDGMNEKRTNGVPVEVDNTPSKRRSSFEKVSTTSSTDDKDGLTEVPTLTKVTDGSEEPISIPEVSIQEVQNLDIDTNGSLLATSGLLSSDRFGQDEENEAENKEILDKEDGEAVEAREEDTLEHQRIDPVGSEEVQVDPLNQSLENDNLNKTDIKISVTAPEDVPEIPPPLETEIPAEITAETPPPFNTAVESPKTEEKGFKKQTSSGDVPKRYVKSDLSKGSSSSLTSLYSASGEAYGKIPITGDVQFGLSYNHKLTQFSINVVACRDLAPVDTKKNKSDPYVKVYLLPDKGRNGKRKSKIKKGTINPQFNELLRYKIKETELRTRTLSVAVWNNDKLGRNFFLGEVLLPLDDIHFDNYNPKWHQLLPKVLDDGGIIYKGDITLALKFEGEGVEADQKAPKSTGALLIHFKSAKNLTAVRPNGSDPYAKCYLEPDRSKAGKRKTKHVRSSCNPNWDQQVQYDNVTIDQLKERALYVTVWDKDTLSANDFLGVISLSLGTGRVGGKDVTYMKSKGEAIRIWEEMLTKPNSWVEATIPLQAKL